MDFQISPAVQDTFCMEQLRESASDLNSQPGHMWPINLLQQRDVPRAEPSTAPEPILSTHLRKLNCCSDVFQCTLVNIPQTLALLKQVKLPLGLIFQPFKDSREPPLLITDVPPRCSSCQTYINPFTAFIDQQHWKCNVCFSLNDVPGNFLFDPMTGSYCNPRSRPELQHAAVEFMVPLEYQAKRPRPVTYLFLFDVSYNAVETGYLAIVCKTLLENLDRLPGDSRTRIGFITFDNNVNFYQLHSNLSRPRMMVLTEINDIFTPNEETLLVNLQQSRQLVVALLEEFPVAFRATQKTLCAFGPALQAAQKLLKFSGGRMTVFLTQLPNEGCGSLQPREDPGDSTLGAKHLGPATDFYKVLSMEFCGQQIGVDLFLLNQQHIDLASLGERRVRIYTYCLPVVSSLSEVYAGANMAAITGILSKMAVDRSVSLCLASTRDELIKVLIDALVAYRSSACSPKQSAFTIPHSLQQLPLYILALLKQPAFQTDAAMSLDERVFTMFQLMIQPLTVVLRMVYPDLYRIDDYLNSEPADNASMEMGKGTMKKPALIQLMAENLTLQGAFLIDCGNVLYIWVGRHCSTSFLDGVLGVNNYTSLPGTLTSLPILQNPASKLIQAFLGSLRKERLYHAPCFIIKDDSTSRSVFIKRLVDDRTETAMSYYEFLLHLKERVCK
ncbi:protein transport protein Sec24A-like isoform X2 [Chiloscyllium punctatum]|uniref:protein transport protein Sec24A-like isoform X2 n=1 Tax=Chiloscyllium punctatum TaxID=137246 RepID=UPI003B640A24